MAARVEPRSEYVARIARIRPSTLVEWRQLFDADSHATFFHGPAWAELWEVQSGGRVRPHPVRVEFADGRSAILGITRVPTRVPGLMRDTLSPEGNCGGWVGGDRLGERHRKALVNVIFAARSCVWRIGPADKNVQRISPEGGREEVTHVIDLHDGPGAARARWNAEARRTASRARRHGARVIEAATKDHWRSYARLYRASVARWDRPLFTYDDSLFSRLAQLAGRGVHLWLVEVDGEACAGALILRHQRYATYWHGATIPQLCPGATNLLHWELLEALANDGIETYDLNGSGPLEGVVRFKESLGAKRERVLAYERRHPLEKAASKAKTVLAGRRS